MVYGDFPRISSSKRSRRKRRILALWRARKEEFEFTFMDEEEWFMAASGSGWVKYLGEASSSNFLNLIRGKVLPVSGLGVVVGVAFWLSTIQCFRVNVRLSEVTLVSAEGGHTVSLNVTIGTQVVPVSFSSVGEIPDAGEIVEKALEATFATSGARTFFTSVMGDQETKVLLSNVDVFQRRYDSDPESNDLTFLAIFSASGADYFANNRFYHYGGSAWEVVTRISSTSTSFAKTLYDRFRLTTPATIWARIRGVTPID